MDVSSHTVLFPAGDKVPTFVHLLPAGTFSGVDGRGPYKLIDPDAVIAASMADGKLPIDEIHSTMLAATIRAPAPARRWIVAMDSRPDGIWGRVEWTETGTALMNDGAYKGLSPVFDHAKDGTVLRIRNAALTNNPNLTQLTAMHAVLTAAERDNLAPEYFAVPGKRLLPIRDAEHVKMAWNLVGETHGLTSVERREAKRRILARAKALGVNTSGWSAHTEVHMDKLAICTALGLADTVDDDAVLAAAQTAAQSASALQTANARIAELERSTVPLARVTELETSLHVLQATARNDKAVAFVDGAIKAGKPITAMRDIYITQHVADAATTEKLVNAMPSLNSMHAAGGYTPPATDGEALNAADMAVCAKMGLDPQKFLENKKRQAKSAFDGRAA